MGDRVFNVCSSCKQKYGRVDENAKRSSNVSKFKDARRNPSSKYSMAKLSPVSKSVKIYRLKKENKVNRDKVKKLLEETGKCTIYLNFMCIHILLLLLYSIIFLY